jgi:hypothetical protein
MTQIILLRAKHDLVSQTVRFVIVPNSGKISFEQLHSAKLVISPFDNDFTKISSHNFHYLTASQLLLIVLFQQFYK